MFQLLLPKKILKAMQKQTSEKLTEIGCLPLTWGELVRHIGTWLFLSTMIGFKRAEFWSQKEIALSSGAPCRLNSCVSGRRFEQIVKLLQFTEKNAPAFKDPFWEARQLIDEWNERAHENFTPSWVNCLDESMSMWFNRCSCPRWTFVPRKPHPFGNERRAICCAVSETMWRKELAEGKDCPKEAQKPEHENLGTAVSLLLRLCKNVFNTGKAAILDSSFCVLKGVIELRKRGACGAAVIKKRRHWPAGVPGKEMDERASGKELGSAD